MAGTILGSCYSHPDWERRKGRQKNSTQDNLEHSKNIPRSSSSLGRTISPSTTVSELSEDSGLGNDEDLKLGVQHEWKHVVKHSDNSDTLKHSDTGDILNGLPCDSDISDFGESSKHKNLRTRSWLELTESLSIECTTSFLPPPVQFSDTAQNRNGNKEYRVQTMHNHVPNLLKHEELLDFKEDDSEESYLSSILTTKHHDMIDAALLQMNKVSKSSFRDSYEMKQVYFLNEIDKGEDIRHDMLWKGQRNILNGKEEETIMSKKGTVRGVKNRVRAGIATFLQDQTRKNYTESEQGVCVLYVTSLGILRQTKARCDLVRKILKNLMVRYDERDVFMSREHFHELSDRLSGSDYLALPKVFLHGQLLGDALTVERLNETGELRTLMKPFQDRLSINSVCDKCGGFGMLPCPLCDGSKKSGLGSIFSTVMLKCAHCDEGGLVKCDVC